MALSLSDQIALINGDVKIKGEDKITIAEILHQAAANFALEFYTTHKDRPQIDLGADPSDPAEVEKRLQVSYIDKMLAVSDQALRLNGEGVKRLFRLLVSVMADYTLANGTEVTLDLIISQGTLARWEDFVKDNILAVIQVYARVQREELAAYNQL